MMRSARFARRIYTASITIAILTPAACAHRSLKAVPADALIGKWEMRGKWASDAVSTIVDLQANGWYSQTLVASSRLRYGYDGKQLVLISVGPDGQPDNAGTVTLTVKFDGDTLVATSGHDAIRMVRLDGNPSSRDIVGRWMTTNEEGKAVVQDFVFDGFVRVQVTLAGEIGRYRVTRDRIEWDPRLPPGSKRTSRFGFRENRLVLAQGEGIDELVRLR